MTLYEEYENGLEPIEYCQRAYKNLVRAVLIYADEEKLFDERDIKFTLDCILENGLLDYVGEKGDARDLLESTFKTKGDYIDPYFTCMMRDYVYDSIPEFLSVHSVKPVKKLNRDKSRTIESLSILNSDLEFLDCASVSGIVRPNNEDYACAIISPLNPNYKLLVMCDGMGGHNNGEIASEIVTKEIVSWFNNYSFSDDFGNLKKEIIDVLKKSKKLIRNVTCLSGTTITFAIIGENQTFIGNVGDSRTYVIKGGNLSQITKDDSTVWKEFYACNPPYYKKDDLRFLKGNNVLTDAIDDFPFDFHLQSYIIPNSYYDGILLFSDGVTDILSDETISRIYRDSDKKELLDNLLYEACYGDFDIPPTCYDEVMIPPMPGKDNASAALYLKLK